MEKELIQKLISVNNALETIRVNGRRDLSNMVGCMSLLDDVISTLSNCVVTTNIEAEKTNE